jgi:hypothetical protein
MRRASSVRDRGCSPLEVVRKQPQTLQRLQLKTGAGNFPIPMTMLFSLIFQSNIFTAALFPIAGQSRNASNEEERASAKRHAVEAPSFLF